MLHSVSLGAPMRRCILDPMPQWGQLSSFLSSCFQSGSPMTAVPDCAKTESRQYSKLFSLILVLSLKRLLEKFLDVLRGSFFPSKKVVMVCFLVSFFSHLKPGHFVTVFLMKFY